MSNRIIYFFLTYRLASPPPLPLSLFSLFSLLHRNNKYSLILKSGANLHWMMGIRQCVERH